ncbi:heterocyst frequency control protein PatD [Nostoc sp. FACHB-973]|nr:heterocyst frequency control protein PatD [Desmonostoc muscorum]MBD2513725.1 heterocyst frequency control protein PatD [Nostoc sp. FACHB-973]MBX9256288.1 heterocyst frequency control protein PatD [Desmonostoc muscorum CCALA 125]MCF2146719.1 heterocyst frequency control protein PatD [Desmonostoc muscorum LEGE 12446]
MSSNCEKYQAFVTLLEHLRSDATTNQIVAPELRRRVASLQQLFGEEIVPLADENWRVQSYQTEMSKQLRLLEIDVMFFQGARQASTAQTRLQTISDRLTTLIQYCNAILQPEAEGEK